MSAGGWARRGRPKSSARARSKKFSNRGEQFSTSAEFQDLTGSLLNKELRDGPGWTAAPVAVEAAVGDEPRRGAAGGAAAAGVRRRSTPSPSRIQEARPHDPKSNETGPISFTGARLSWRRCTTDSSNAFPPF